MLDDLSQAGSATAGEFAANRADLGAFVEQGKQYVDNLEVIHEQLRTKRSMVAHLFGAGVGPVDSSTRSLQELTVEARTNNAFVEQIRESLAAFDGGSAPPVAMNARIDRDLASAGLTLDGVDRSLERDLSTFKRAQAARLGQAGLGSPVVGQLIDHPDAGEAAIALLRLGVHPDAIEPDGVDRLLDVAQLIQSEAAHRLDPQQIEALLARAFAPDLDRQVLSGLLAPPTDAIRERVVAAMVAGQTPKDAGLAPTYFPARYRRYLDVEQEIVDLEFRREVADGSSWSWWDNDDATLAAVDEELRDLQEERAALIDLYQVRDVGVGRFAALAATSDTTAGYRWEGEAYADHFIGYHDSKISDGGWLFGAGEGAIEDPDGNDVELRHIGRRLTTDRWAAVAFYNRIGVARVSDLPTFLAGNDLDVEAFNLFGAALGSASRATAASGSPALGFSGRKLIRHPKPDTQDGVIWYNPALLFVEGEFDPAFLAEAAEAALFLAEEGNRQGTMSHLGHESVSGVGGGTVVTFDGGEDPRNILLVRASESAAAVRVLMTSLGGPRGRGWPGAPSAGTLEPLLKPEEPFGPTARSDSKVHWLDELGDLGNVSGPDRSGLDPVAYPDLGVDYAITKLLGAVAADPILSRWALLYTAQSIARSGPMAQDPGTAAGLDLILARHATLMFEPADLALVGIERTTLNDDAPIGVRPEDWKAVHGEVLRLGRGQALAGRADDLLMESIIGSINSDGVFTSEQTSPFAHMAARTEVEAVEALISYSSQLDDRARAKNRAANVTASVSLALLGLSSGLAGSGGSVGWAAFFDGYPTDHELEVLRTEREANLLGDNLRRWRLIIAEASLEARFASSSDRTFATMDLQVPDVGRRSVRIRRDVGSRGVRYMWQHPESAAWAEIPAPGMKEFGLLLAIDPTGATVPYRAAISGADQVNEDFQDGLLVAVEDEIAIAFIKEEMERTETQADALRIAINEVRDAEADVGWTFEWVAEGRPRD